MLLLLIFLFMGHNSFLDADENFFDDLPNGTLYYNLGQAANESYTDILFVSIRNITDALPYVCENKTSDINLRKTNRAARESCELISIKEWSALKLFAIRGEWMWVKNATISGLTTHKIFYTGTSERCRSPCSECTANNSALAARQMAINISFQPQPCNDDNNVIETTTKVDTEITYIPSIQITTNIMPVLPPDSKTKYLWLGIAISTTCAIVCLLFVCCKVCSDTTRKPEVSPYGEPSDVLKSITSEYSTPYDARSSSSAIVTVRAEPKLKRLKNRSFKGSFRNTFKRLTSRKVKKKEEAEDSGYSEISDFSRTKRNDKCSDDKPKKGYKECIIEYSKNESSNPYAVILLTKE